MQYTNIQLEAIRIFGRKEQSFGCIYHIEEEKYNQYVQFIQTASSPVKAGMKTISISKPYYTDGHACFTHLGGVMIGHEPHLEDVFRVASDGNFSYYELFPDHIEFWNELGIQKDSMNIPYKPTIPLLEQSEDTLTQLCNLFK